MRGHELEWADGRRGLITVHPSYLLRIPDRQSKDAEFAKFVHDLKLAARLQQQGMEQERLTGESNSDGERDERSGRAVAPRGKQALPDRWAALPAVWSGC